MVVNAPGSILRLCRWLVAGAAVLDGLVLSEAGRTIRDGRSGQDHHPPALGPQMARSDRVRYQHHPSASRHGRDTTPTVNRGRSGTATALRDRGTIGSPSLRHGTSGACRCLAECGRQACAQAANQGRARRTQSELSDRRLPGFRPLGGMVTMASAVVGAFSVLMNQNRLYSFILTRLLYANRCPLRSKTGWCMKKPPYHGGFSERDWPDLFDDLNDAVRVRIDQHRAVVHDRVAIVANAIFLRHVVIGHAA